MVGNGLKIDSKSISVYLFVALIYTALAPWFFWFALAEISTVISLALGFVLLVHGVPRKRFTFSVICYFVALLYLSVLGANPLIAIALSLPPALIMLFEPEEVTRISNLFKKALAVVCVPGLVFWVVHVITGDLSFGLLGVLPESIVSDIKNNALVKYIIYPFSLRIETPASQLYFPGVYRFQSLFNEPGLLGTICALYLAGERFDKFDKYSFVLLVSGLASFSLAFYLIYFFFLLIVGFRYFKVLVLGVLVSAVILIPVLVYTDFFNIFILSRLSFDGGTFSGDNRATAGLDQLYMDWMGSNSVMDVLFGIPYEPDGSSSWMILFIRGGLVGFFLLLLYYFIVTKLFIARRRLTLFLLAFFIVFVISAYQRLPGVSLVYVFLLVQAIVNSHQSSAHKKIMVNN